MNEEARGRALVAAQFALIALLGLPAAPRFLRLEAGLAAWALGLAGAALGAWAVSANRPGNFNIRPVPKEGGHLVEHGPYRSIRHPMYSAVALLGAACALAIGAAWAWLDLVALAVVLAVKAGVEERAMIAAHPGYADYARRTKRFVPGLY